MNYRAVISGVWNFNCFAKWWNLASPCDCLFCKLHHCYPLEGGALTQRHLSYPKFAKTHWFLHTSNAISDHLGCLCLFQSYLLHFACSSCMYIITYYEVTYVYMHQSLFNAIFINLYSNCVRVNKSLESIHRLFIEYIRVGVCLTWGCGLKPVI